MLHITHTREFIPLSCAHTHSHFFITYHALEKVLLYVFPLSFVCWIMFMSGLSGPSCLMATLSSNCNLSETQHC